MNTTSFDSEHAHSSGVWLDWLHIFLLALIPDAVASALWLLVQKAGLRWHASKKDLRLHQAFAEYKTFCRLRGIRYRAPKTILWKLKGAAPAGSYPSLSQKHCKGFGLPELYVLDIHTEAQFFDDKHIFAYFSLLIRLG